MNLLRIAAVIAVLSGLSGSAQAGPGATFGLYTLGTIDQTADRYPGGTLDLWVRVDVTETTLGYASYDVQLPEEGWVLSNRVYGDYGWQVGGAFDASAPMQPVISGPVTNLTYADTPFDPDFHFQTATEEGSPLEEGLWTVETFRLTLPGSLAPGDYKITMGNQSAWDGDGNDVASDINGRYLVTVHEIIPEPSSLGLGLAGVGLLGLLRRRRAAA